VRAVQERFAELATPNVRLLRRVLRGSSDAKQRALAAQVIAYATDKRSIVADLAFAMGDPDATTRNEAMRALLVLAKYARANPRLKLKIPTIGFVRMLSSLVWTDRNKAAGAIDVLTLSRGSRLMEELKRNAVASLAEMARWKSPGHAQAAFNILGRMAGLSEADIISLWGAGDREKVIGDLLRKIVGATGGYPRPADED
jgi:hypothetical protein